VTTFRRLLLLASSLGLAATGTGCTEEPVKAWPPGPHGAPTQAADCADLPHLDGDPGIVLGSDWTGERHDFTDSVVIFACVTASFGGRVSLAANGTGIQVRPRFAVVDPSGNGIIAFRVTVSKHAAGGLRVQQDGAGGGGDLPGPAVIADADGWHFAPAGESDPR